jgi:CheY-like chemotaxis protein
MKGSILTAVDEAAGEARVFGNRYRMHPATRSSGLREIFLGDDLVLERTVAIKVLHENVAEDCWSLERARSEASQLGPVASPLIGIYDVGSANGDAYLVLHQVAGLSIEQEILRMGPMSGLRMLHVVVQLFDRLADMRCHGVAHRDLRPSSVLIDDRDDVLFDLGIVLGSRPTLGADHSQAVPLDIYQVGQLMLYLLSGVDSTLLLYAPSRTELIDRLPWGLARVVRRALERDPAKQYATTRGMKAAIATAIVAPEGWARRGRGRATFEPTRRRRYGTAAHASPYMRDPLIIPPPRTTVAGARLLIVDEDVPSRERLHEQLSSRYNIAAMGEADAGAKIRAGERYDVILCSLPEPQSFFELVWLARPDQARSIVFLTAAPIRAPVQTFLDCVTNAALPAPFELAKLRALIDGRIARQRR